MSQSYHNKKAWSHRHGDKIIPGDHMGNGINKKFFTIIKNKIKNKIRLILQHVQETTYCEKTIFFIFHNLEKFIWRAFASALVLPVASLVLMLRQCYRRLHYMCTDLGRVSLTFHKLQNILSKFVSCRNRTSYENFKLQLFKHAQSHAYVQSFSLKYSL